MRTANPGPHSQYPEGDLKIRRFPLSERSLATYGLLVALLLVCKLVFVLLPVSYYLRDQASAFAWPTLLGIILFGFAGLLLAPRAGFADMWDEHVSNTRRFALPVVDGIVYGLVTIVALDLLNPSDVHIAFPASILFYTYGGIFLEILLRLFGLTLLTWVLAAVAGAVKLPRSEEVGFWIANVVVSLYEPMPYILEQLAKTPPRGDPGIWIHWAFEPLFLANLLTGYIYRRFGFLSAVVLRLSFYAVWHVAYGGFRPFWLSL
ncbi:MAG TPA: hypothetical protein VGD02_06045 [Gemmatimonadaceae bacterium]|jgi:hypothetical protein